MNTRRIWRCAVTLGVTVLALLGRETVGAADSDLLPPGNLELYKKKVSDLTSSDRWRIMIHGLRGAPLHPEVWAVRKNERTENRRLVPMRPFVLRLSESPYFFLEELTIRFKFQETSAPQMRKKPSTRDPVLDIGFGGEYRAAPHRPAIDAGYVARVTAFPDFVSGIYYQSLGRFEMVRRAEVPTLTTGEEHVVTVQGSTSGVALLLDGSEIASVRGDEINRGMVSLMTGWQALKISELKVRGYTLGQDGKRAAVVASGLVDISLPDGEKGKHR